MTVQPYLKTESKSKIAIINQEVKVGIKIKMVIILPTKGNEIENPHILTLLP
jgi:hypothetical protein